jgi:hypothetical protein
MKMTVPARCNTLNTRMALSNIPSISNYHLKMKWYFEKLSSFFKLSFENEMVF